MTSWFVYKFNLYSPLELTRIDKSPFYLFVCLKYFTDRPKAVLLLLIIYFISVLYLLCFQVMFQELDVGISMGEINKAVKNLKNSKSAGPDLIINEFLKYVFHVLKPYLHKLFNVIIRLGTTQAFGASVLLFLFSKRGTSKTLKIIEALRCSVLLVCLLLFLTIG